MVHTLTSLLLVDHYFFRKLTQDINPSLPPDGRSKLLRSLIPIEKQSVERSVVERLEKVKAVVIS